MLRIFDSQTIRNRIYICIRYKRPQEKLHFAPAQFQNSVVQNRFAPPNLEIRECSGVTFKKSNTFPNKTGKSANSGVTFDLYVEKKYTFTPTLLHFS